MKMPSLIHSSRWLSGVAAILFATQSMASQAPNVEIIYLGEPTVDEANLEKWAHRNSAYRDARHLAELGHIQSQFNFAMMSHIRGNTKQAVYWYKRAASRNHGPAAYNLAAMYSEGDGVSRDQPEAAHWMQKSAEAGYGPGQFQLAKMYFHGTGVAKDPSKEAYWYRRAAENDIGAAAHNLAVLYHKGEGVEKNDEKAKFWLEQSRSIGFEKRY